MYNDKENLNALHKAMLNAQEAFVKSLEKENFDPAFFCIDLKGYIIAHDFWTPMHTESIENFKTMRIANDPKYDDRRRTD